MMGMITSAMITIWCFLKATDLQRAIACINDVLTGDRVFGNDLRAGAIVAVEHQDGYRVIYPPGYPDEFRV